MKKVLSLVLAATFILCAFAACGGSSTNYLSWKNAEYTKASDADKLKCVEAFTNATLKAQGQAEVKGEELTASATALQPVLEAGLAQYPDKSVQEIIDMSIAAQQNAGNVETEGAAAEDATAEDATAEDATAEDAAE